MKSNLVHGAVAMLLTGTLVSTQASAAVVTYALQMSEYAHQRLDPATNLPLVMDTGLGVSGTVKIDTATGELIAATLVLGNYNETFNYAPPWEPFGSNFASLSIAGEQFVAGSGIVGEVDGYSIRFQGANAWSGATLGSVSCTASAGAEGNALCAGVSNADLAWGNFDIVLDFNSDFSLFVTQIYPHWVDEGDLFHTDRLMGLVGAQVPVPAAAWLFGSALVSLLWRARRS